MNQNDIEREVEKTLALLDSARPAKASPFFYTRLHARIQTDAAKRQRAGRPFSARVVLAAAGIAALVFINLYSLASLSSRSESVRKEQALATFGEEYNLTCSRY